MQACMYRCLSKQGLKPSAISHRKKSNRGFRFEQHEGALSVERAHFKSEPSSGPFLFAVKPKII